MKTFMEFCWIVLSIAFLYWSSGGNALTFTIDRRIQSGYNESFNLFWDNETSLVQCASRCFSRGRCETMAFNFNLNTCRLYYIEVTPQIQLVPATNLISFYKAYPCLRPDYDYRSDYGVCIKTHWGSNFTSATDVCINEGGKLLIANTSAMFNLLLQVVAETSGVNWWLGAERDQSDVSRWYWSNGDLITLNNGGQHWYPGFPLNDDRHCLVAKFEGGLLRFKNNNCTNNYRFICERPLTYP